LLVEVAGTNLISFNVVLPNHGMCPFSHQEKETVARIFVLYPFAKRCGMPFQPQLAAATSSSTSPSLPGGMHFGTSTDSRSCVARIRLPFILCGIYGRNAIGIYL
jgi:hypothetical protein